MTTSNINISNSEIKGQCDLKCSYNFKYSESNLTGKNNGAMITINYDNSSVPPVLYNNNKYSVSNIFITSPSIHNFNGKPSPAEIIIEHVPVKGGPNLSVAVPIIASAELSASSNLLSQIIDTMSTNAPRQGDSTSINISDFSLQNIVPNKPFYSYTDLQGNDWVVFGIFDAIPLSDTILKTLSQIITPFSLETRSNGGLFFNSTGPNSVSVGEGIYISCKPTGSSSEETSVTKNKNQQIYNLSSILDNPTAKMIIQILIGCIIFIIVFVILNYFYSFIIRGGIKSPIQANTNTNTNT
jgi:carbonic anhydrase